MKKIAQIILAVAIVALVYVIYDQISTPIKFDDELKAKKAQVIDRIKDIRTAQRAFKSKYQRFTGSFDTLANFILQDTLELERKIVDEDDSVAMAQLKKMGKKNVEKFKIAVIDTIFSPNTVTTRAQLVQVLYNLEGKPDVSDVAVPFTDAASGWYRDAVAWAYKTGVVDGMSPTTFAPNNTVTREQVAVILMRYLTKVCGVERTWTPDDLSGFADGGSVSGWARAGMADAVALGLFGGTQDRNGQVWLRPGAGTTRAETAALLQRMCTKVLGIGCAAHSILTGVPAGDARSFVSARVLVFCPHILYSGGNIGRPRPSGEGSL